MNFYYCQSCFKKTPQTASIVTKCSHCGKVSEVSEDYNPRPSQRKIINEMVNNWDNAEYRKRLIDRAAAEKQRRIRPEVEIDNLNDDLDEDIDENNDGDTEDDNISVPHINKLKVEVEIPENSGIPIRSLAKGAARRQKVKPKDKQIKIDKKQFLANFQKSASTLRKG